MTVPHTHPQPIPRFARMQALVVALGIACTECTEIINDYTYRAGGDVYIVLDSSQFTSPADVDPRYMTAYAQGHTFYIERVS